MNCKALTPVRAIRQKCSECAGAPRAATHCEKEDCPLYPYRTGRNPARAGIGGGDRHGNGRFSQKRTTQVEGPRRGVPPKSTRGILVRNPGKSMSQPWTSPTKVSSPITSWQFLHDHPLPAAGEGDAGVTAGRVSCRIIYHRYSSEPAGRCTQDWVPRNSQIFLYERKCYAITF